MIWGFLSLAYVKSISSVANTLIEQPGVHTNHASNQSIIFLLREKEKKNNNLT